MGTSRKIIFKCKQKTADSKITKNNTTKQLLIQDLLPSNKWEQPAAVGQSYVRQNIFKTSKANGFTRHLLNMLPDDTAGRASAGSVPKPEGPQSVVALRPAQRHFAKFRSFQFYPSFSEVITRFNQVVHTECFF